MTPNASPDIRNEPREALAARFAEWGQPAYRLEQLLGWLYARRAASWDEMSNLPRSLREQLAAGRAGVRDVEARTAAALVEAQRHGW